MNKYLIYALIDPVSNEVRYIGRSSSGLSRPKWHSCKSTLRKSNLKVHNWIKSLIYQQKQPLITVLEQWEQIDNDALNKAEIKWIALYKQCGAKLTNLTDGGDGLLGRKLSLYHKQKITESNKTRKYSPETLEKMRLAAFARQIHKPKKLLYVLMVVYF